MILFELFISFAKIGLFSFGGGYAAIPLIQEEIIKGRGWMSMETFTNMLAISEMTPGPLGVNSATFIGIQLSGISGAIVATLGFVVPSFIIVSILGHLYLKYQGLEVVRDILQGVRPVVVAMILSAGISLLLSAFFEDKKVLIENINYLQVSLFAIAMLLNLKFKLSPIKIMMIIGASNVALTYMITGF